MSYLRSQSQYGAALGPKRKQNVSVICNAFGVTPALAAKHESAIATMMHKRLGVVSAAGGYNAPASVKTKVRAERVVEICTTWRTGREIMGLADLTVGTWDSTRRHCLREGMLVKRGKNNATEYRAAV